MDTNMPIMKGSICPICRSMMYFDQSEGKAILKCSIADCDYNDEMFRNAYFREKHKSLILESVLHKYNENPKLKSLLREKESEK